MRRVLVVLALAACGTKPAVLEKAQEKAQAVYYDVRDVLVEGVDWTVETLGKGMEWTHTRLDACFAGKGYCDLAVVEDGKDGSDGAAGADGVDGSDGIDGVSCTATNVSNGALITCGNQSAVVLNGQDGSDGVDGADGLDGLDGVDGVDGVNGADAESCKLERRNQRCRRVSVRYDLYLTCGQDSEKIGTYSRRELCTR